MALYDPNELSETTTDFTLADVLAWARTRPSRGRYDYRATYGCVMCQFLAETGRAKLPWVSFWAWGDGFGGGPTNDLDERLDDAAAMAPWTFGAFAARLETAMAERAHDARVSR